MDFLNQSVTQIRELFLSMTPAARVTAVLLAGVIGVSLAYLVQHQSTGTTDYLFNGEIAHSADIDRAEAAIARAGLQDFDRVGNRIRIPRNKKAEYLAAVAEAGALPPNFHTLLEEALDLGPFVDDRTRRQRFKAAREQQLSMIIRKMAGVEDATVIYDISETRGLSRIERASATVSVLPRAGEALSPTLTKMIKKAVAGAISNLEPDNVVVINLGNGASFAGEISPESFDDPYYQNRVAFERHMKKNIENILSYIPGVQVQVTAELDESLVKESRLTTPEGEAAPLQETTDNETSETTHVDNRGRPGLVAQGPGRDADREAEVTVKQAESAQSTKSNFFVGQKEEFRTEAGLVPQHVRAAIAVPTDYLVKIYREQQRRRNADPNEPLPADFDTTLELLQKKVVQNIEGAVATLLPKEQAEFNYSDVSVSFFETLSPDPVEPPSMAMQALAWAGQHFNSLMMTGIVLVGMVMLRSVIKSIPLADTTTSEHSPVALSLTSSSDEGSASSEVEEQPERPRLKLKKGVSLKDELTDIVREDPDSAAAILRSWISNAS